MANLTFYYGVMGAGKTAHLLIRAYKKEDVGKKIKIIKPKLDTKAENYIQSRIGGGAMKRKVDLLLSDDTSLKTCFENG